MKPDIIVCWPRNCDFPLWREFIRNERDRFGEVFVVFTETYEGLNFIEFVATAMVGDRITFIKAPDKEESGDIDWRHAAIHKALPLVKSEWIWFTEQDFLPTHPDFWAIVEASSEKADAIGIREGTRLHPACLFMRKDALEMTNKFFGIIKDRADHFGQIEIDITRNQIPLAIIGNHWSHMNGLSQNCRLMFAGEMPNYKPDEFVEYLQKCKKAKVPIDERFMEATKRYLYIMRHEET